MNTNFSSRIKELRTSLHITQAEFASEIGTTQAALSAYEKGDRIPSYEILNAIAINFNISIDWLCGLSESKSITGIPQTMGDVLKMLFSLDSSTDMQIFSNEEILDTGMDPAGYPDLQPRILHEIGFTNYYLNNYICEWNKILTLYKNHTIDYEVYSLWIEKTIKKADALSPLGIPLNPESEEELPFET